MLVGLTTPPFTPLSPTLPVSLFGFSDAGSVPVHYYLPNVESACKGAIEFYLAHVTMVDRPPSTM